MKNRNLFILMGVAIVVLILVMRGRAVAETARAEAPKNIKNGPPAPPHIGPFDTDIFQHLTLGAESFFQGGEFGTGGAGADF